MSQLMQFMPPPETYKSEIGSPSTMCQVQAGAYVSLPTPGGTKYSDCHPSKTTTYILHVVCITTHTHDRHKSIGEKETKNRKEYKGKKRNEKRNKTKKASKEKKKTRNARKDKTRKQERKKRKKEKRNRKRRKKNVILADPRNWLRMALG